MTYFINDGALASASPTARVFRRLGWLESGHRSHTRPTLTRLYLELGCRDVGNQSKDGGCSSVTTGLRSRAFSDRSSGSTGIADGRFHSTHRFCASGTFLVACPPSQAGWPLLGSSPRGFGNAHHIRCPRQSTLTLPLARCCRRTSSELSARELGRTPWWGAPGQCPPLFKWGVPLTARRTPIDSGFMAHGRDSGLR